jgi:hypothetical protein
VAQYSHPNKPLITSAACTIRKYYLQRESSSRAHSPDEYLVSSVCQFFFQPPLSRPNQTCIQHTMRFTTWSTLTNAFIISTVALLSLIQAANALDLYIVTPNSHDSPFLSGGPITIRWYVPNRAGSPGQDRSLMTGISGPPSTMLKYL